MDLLLLLVLPLGSTTACVAPWINYCLCCPLDQLLLVLPLGSTTAGAAPWIYYCCWCCPLDLLLLVLPLGSTTAAMSLLIVAVEKGALNAAAVRRLPSSALPFAYVQETVNMMGQGSPHPPQAL